MRLPPIWHIDIIEEDIIPLRSKQHILDTASLLGLSEKITENQFIELKKTISCEIYHKVNSDPRYISHVKRMCKDFEPNARATFGQYISDPLEKEIRSLFEVQEPKSLTSWIWSLLTTFAGYSNTG